MPYRRLPNTDNGRLTALRSANNKATNTAPEELPFSAENNEKLKVFFPRYQKEMEERGIALSVQSGSTSLRITAEEKCRLLVSHFIQVFNMGVMRGIYKVNERAYFQLPVSQETLPELRGTDSVITWAENIINGDPMRVQDGGAVMQNPSAAEVQAAYNDFKVKVADQSKKKDTYDKEQKDVDAIRAEADDLINDIWDEIEFTYRKLEPAAMRRKAREYGVVYISQPGEPAEEQPAGSSEQTNTPAN